MADNVNVVYMPIPLELHCNGFVVLKGGVYNIVINCNLSQEQQDETIRHELAHLRHDDFHNSDDLETAEARAVTESRLTRARE